MTTRMTSFNEAAADDRGKRRRRRGGTQRRAAAASMRPRPMTAENPQRVLGAVLVVEMLQ